MDLPKKCCKWTGDGFCNEPALYWYSHNGDVCSYCDKHNYTCGKPVNVATKEKILEVLKSIRKIERTSDGQVDVYFENSDEPFQSVEFVGGSFTRELIELIEAHLEEDHE